MVTVQQLHACLCTCPYFLSVQRSRHILTHLSTHTARTRARARAIHARTHARVRAPCEIHTHTHVHIHVHTHVHALSLVHVHTHVHTHDHAHTNIHAHHAWPFTCPYLCPYTGRCQNVGHAHHRDAWPCIRGDRLPAPSNVQDSQVAFPVAASGSVSVASPIAASAPASCNCLVPVTVAYSLCPQNRQVRRVGGRGQHHKVWPILPVVHSPLLVVLVRHALFKRRPIPAH